MKTALIASFLLLAPAPVLAQSSGAAAAGAVPNSFDAPAAQATTPAPRPTPQPSGPPAQRAPTASPADIAKGEAALRDLIGDIQGAGLDYSVFTDNLAAQIREQSAQVTPLIKSFGELREIDHQRAEGQAQLYRATFENQVTEWLIGFDDDGKIAALLFRPAES
jgi:predicted component of type VI protein secretion system